MTHRPSRSFAVFRHAVLLLGALVYLMPFVWMLATSLKSPDQIFAASLSLWPEGGLGPALDNYTAALTRVPLLTYLLNGVIVCAGILVLQILVTLPAAYAFAKLKFRGKQLGWALVLLGLLIPYQATAIPLYVMFHYMGLLDTYLGLMLPFVFSAFGIFLLRQYFMTVPDDLINAARLDGFSEFELVWRIMLPTAKTALLAFAIFSVVWHWNDYFWPLLVTSSPELATPPLGTVFFRNEEAGTEFGPLMAGTVLITLPLLLLFLVFQRRFIEGVTLSSVKG